MVSSHLRRASVGWVLVASTLTAIACGEESGVPDPRVLQEPLTIDENLTHTQLRDVEQAIQLWTQASGQAFVPEIMVGPVECGQPFAIKAVASEGCGVGQALPDSDELRVLGVANAQAHTITVVSWLDGSRFRYNVAHELGHYLFVGHGEGLMAQERWGQDPVVTEETVQELCSVWRCGPGAQPVVLGSEAPARPASAQQSFGEAATMVR